MLLLLAGLPMAATAAPTTQPAIPMAGVAGEQAAFQTLLAQAKEGKLDAARRREAVGQLLNQYRTRAIEALTAELKPEGDAGTQQVIVQALWTSDEDPPVDLAFPLVALLDRADESFLADLAVALGRFDDHRVLKRLTDQAVDNAAPVARRRGCILALGYHRSQATARLLLTLIQPNNPPPVRTAAFTSLMLMTGIDEFGSDLGRWQRWWEQHRRVSEEQWLEELLTYHARKNEQAMAQSQKLQARVVELQRQLYRATAQDARPALLAAMLADALEPCRSLAIDLVIQRLTDAQPVNPPLREALLARLDDASPAIRQGTARILRELADAGGADAVAQRLADGREADPDVLRAYLLVLARVPRASALDAAIQWLGDAVLGGEAAAAVGKAVEARLLSPEQTITTNARLKELTTGDAPPDPRVIELFGRMASDEEWARIAHWLDDKDAAVRAAAASAWAQSNQPLAPLAQRASDPVIRQRLIEAATQRGDDGPTLLVLVRFKPEQEQAAAAWQRCVVTMAGRVDSEAALAADKALVRLKAPAALRNEFLSAAIGKVLPEVGPITTTNPAPPGTAPGVSPAPGVGATTAPVVEMSSALLDLLLARGELRLEQGDANQALPDFRRVDGAGGANGSAGEAQRKRARWGLFRASLDAGESDAALERAKKILAAAPTDAELKDAVIQAYLGNVQRSLATGQVDPASKALRQLREILGASTPAVIEKIAELETKATTARPTVTPLPVPPVPTPEVVPVPLPEAPPATAPAGAASRKG